MQNSSWRPHDLGALARRLRQEADLTSREVGEELGVSHVAVIRAEGGSPSLQALARRAVGFLIGRLTGTTPEVRGGPHAFGGGDDWLLDFGPEGYVYTQNLRAAEIAWREALVSGFLGGIGLSVETGDGVAVARNPDQALPKLRVGLTRGDFEVRTRKGTRLIVELEASPFAYADRETWGAVLEDFAYRFVPSAPGWLSTTRAARVLARAGRSEERRPEVEWVLVSEDRRRSEEE